MAGKESNGTCIGEFPSLVLGSWNCNMVSQFFFYLVRVLVNFTLLCLEQHFFFDLQAPGNLDQQDCWFVFSSA